MATSVSHVKPFVFVVDDDISVRESLELLVRYEDWEAETYASAQGFLARSHPHIPSCLVLDVFLPGLKGLDVRKRLTVKRADMPIMLIRGYADVPTSVRAIKADAVKFLRKPSSVVSELLDKQVRGELGISEIAVKAHRRPSHA